MNNTLPSDLVSPPVPNVEDSIRLWNLDQAGMTASVGGRDGMVRPEIGSHDGQAFSSSDGGEPAGRRSIRSGIVSDEPAGGTTSQPRMTADAGKAA